MTEWLAVGLAIVWVLLLLEGLALVVLMREIGRIHLRLGPPLGARVTDDGPQIGRPLPRIEVLDQRGVAWDVGGPRTKPLLLVFMSEGCPACSELAPHLAAFQRSGEADVVLTFESLQAGADRFLREHGLEKTACIVDTRLPYLFAVHRYPYALLADRAGILQAKGIANNLLHLESLLAPLEVFREQVSSTGPIPEGLVSTARHEARAEVVWRRGKG